MRHGWCGHTKYHLNCSEYEALLRRSQGRCERCSVAIERHHIDHDHALGRWAVRGVLCPKCNARMGRVDAGRIPANPEDESYLSNAWHTHNPNPRIGLSRSEVAKLGWEGRRGCWDRGLADMTSAD